MNKLEELKALIADEKKWRLEWINARRADDDSDVVLSYLMEFKAVNSKRRLLSDELLPQLIAIAEAAKKVCWYDFSTSELDGDVILDMRHLQTALEPLTKDTDK